MLWNRHDALACLVDEMIGKVSVVGCISDSQRDAIDTLTHTLSIMDNYAVVFSTVCSFIKQIGLFVKNCLTTMENVSRGKLLQFSATTLVRSMDNISEVVAKRVGDKKTYFNSTLIVLLHLLCQHSYSRFLKRSTAPPRASRADPQRRTNWGRWTRVQKPVWLTSPRPRCKRIYWQLEQLRLPCLSSSQASPHVTVPWAICWWLGISIFRYIYRWERLLRY